MTSVVIIGAGNLATHLFHHLEMAEGINVIQVYNRSISEEKQKIFGNKLTDKPEKIEEADMYLMAVSDDAIAMVSDALPFENRLVVHCSGNTTILKLNSKNRRGVFYPLQSFSKSKAVDFKKIPVCLEAEEMQDMDLLNIVAASLSENIYTINSEQRKKIHLAAVFANNFVNHMYFNAKGICDENNIPFEVLHPLIMETAEKAVKTDPKNAQTGPARRSDIKTINSHLQQLTNTTQKDIYTTITNSIIDQYGRKEL